MMRVQIKMFDFTEPTNQEGTKSLFNAGIAQAQRVHELQAVMNQAWLCPEGLDESLYRYNYQIIFTCIERLFQEVRPKCSEKEVKQFEEHRDIVKKALREFPIVGSKDERSPDRKSVITENLDVLDVLGILESEVRTLLDKHKLNSPSEEAEGGFD